MIKDTYVVEPEEIQKVLRDYKLRDRALHALLLSWDQRTLKDIIDMAYWDEESMIDLIRQEDLFSPDDDELIRYFNFKDYPEHEKALIDAGIILPREAAESRLGVKTDDMKDQPELPLDV